ncbi:MAG: hypothetical protein ACFFG0_08470 [Candidatus Thorarchaeota archaeon]
MDESEEKKYLELYKIIVDEEHDFFKEHQKRIEFYIGLFSVLIVGIAFGLFLATEWYHFAYLSIVPVIIVVVSYLANKGTYRLYQRFIEAITMRAKIEQKLGLTEGKYKKLKDKKSEYWQDEPIVSYRHLKARIKTKSSRDFFKRYRKKGYHKVTTILNYLIIGASTFILALFIFLMVIKLINWI